MNMIYLYYIFILISHKTSCHDYQQIVYKERKVVPATITVSGGVTMATAQYCASDKPTEKQLAKELKKVEEWQSLAIALPKIEMDHIETIEKNYKLEERQKLAFYKKWLEVCPNATWSDIIDGLKEIECNAIAEGLEEKLTATAKEHNTTQHNNTVTLEHQDTVLSELEELHSNFSNLYTNIVKKLERLCEEETDKLLDIARYAESLMQIEQVKLTDSTNIDELMHKLHPYYDFLKCGIIRRLVDRYVTDDQSIVDDMKKHIQYATEFMQSNPIKTLREDLKTLNTPPLNDGKTMASINVKISDKWDEIVIQGLYLLINHVLPQPYPKISLFKYIKIMQGSICIQYVVLQSYVEATISHAEQHRQFMRHIGIYSLVIDGTTVVSYDEDMNFSFDESLLQAAEDGNIDSVRLLLDIGTDVNYQNKDGWTALMVACQNGHYQVVELLLHNNADPNIQEEDGWTVLIFACENGHYQVVELLLHNNADPKVQEGDGWTALMFACQNGHYQVVELLLHNNADPNVKTKNGVTALMAACQNGHYQVVELLLHNNADPNVQTKDGVTALMFACQNGHYQVVELLLHNSADPKVQKEDGWTALMSACHNGHYQVVELLLHNNVDIFATTHDNLTALVFACFNGHSNIIHLLADKQGIDPMITEFIILCIEGDTDQVKTLLPQVDLNTPLTYGITPLMMASCHGHIDIVNVLLQHKAKVNSQDDRGSTALDYAISRQHDNIVSLIMDYDGVSKSDILQTFTESTDDQDDVISHHYNITHQSDITMHQSDIITHHSDVKKYKTASRQGPNHSLPYIMIY